MDDRNENKNESGFKLTVRREGDAVRIDFGKKVAWISLLPDWALIFAASITTHAMMIKEDGDGA